MLTSTELQTEMIRLSRLLDKGIEHLPTASQDYAEADSAFHEAHAKAFLNAVGTVGERTAEADLATVRERFDMKLADGMRRSTFAAVTSRRAQISAWQTLANAYRAEAEFVRTTSSLDG